MSIKRDTEAIACECGGYADNVRCTPQEIAKQSCGRSYECCVRVFVCRVCKKRIVENVEAPEANWD